MPTRTPTERYKHWLAGVAVALVGALVTAVLVHRQWGALEEMDRARFVQETRAFTDSLQQRIASNSEVVNGLRGLFTANPRLSRLEFERAVSELEVGQRHPGVRSLWFSRWVPAAEKEAFEARVRTDRSLSPEGFPQFVIYPEGERPEYFVVEYIWPFPGNAATMGLDIIVDPDHLSAMRYSRDSGHTVLSKPFQLLQEDQHRAAVVVGVPVFDPTADAPEQRFLGTVASTIRVYDLVRGLGTQGYLNGITVALTDRGAAWEAASDRLEQPLTAHTGVALPGAGSEVRDLVVHDRRWRLTFYPTRSFLSEAESGLPWQVGLAGLLTSLLLASTVALLVRQRILAVAQLRLSDAARQESDQRFEALFNQATMGVAQTHTSTGHFLRVNQRFADIVGYSRDELKTMGFPAITFPEDLAADYDLLERLGKGGEPELRLEKRYICKDGSIVWVDLTVSHMWFPEAGGEYHISVVQDISSRMRMEEELRASEQRLRSILERLPVGLCLLHNDGRIGFRNQRHVEISGYAVQETPDADTWMRLAFPDASDRAAACSLWQAGDQRARASNGVIAPAEYTIRCKDGVRRPVEVSGVYVDDGRLITLQDLSERRAAEEEINSLAYYDPLTRLPNRRLLLDRLQHALVTSARHQRSGALLMLDMDNFKTLNDTRGHEQGDALLQQVAHRLRSCVHDDDTVARQGGDEFVVVLEDLGDTPEEAAARSEETGQRILALLREPYRLGGGLHHSSISMGVAVFSGLRESVDELLKRADLALYQAKDAGRDTLRFFDPRIQAAVSARAALEAGMREGIEQGAFELYYQPQIDRGRIVGAEALLRWRHPRDGFISPAQFIPLAESSGLILPLGQWVIQAACQQLAAWAPQPALASLTLAVNVSARQFRQPDFVGQVLAALAGSGAEGRRLELEITESLLLEDVEDTIQKMAQLKAYGVGFSLDDFGTGYSSLAYLKRLPLDKLKIDQGFVRDVLTDPNDAAIARTVVALGTSLGLRVIAEGVETEAQREFLERNHCHAWQGYLFSPPVPVAQFEALVERALDRGAAPTGPGVPPPVLPSPPPSVHGAVQRAVQARANPVAAVGAVGAASPKAPATSASPAGAQADGAAVAVGDTE